MHERKIKRLQRYLDRLLLTESLDSKEVLKLSKMIDRQIVTYYKKEGYLQLKHNIHHS